jgi:methionyl-tRNA formyltransferase
MTENTLHFAFFGTPDYAVYTLEALKSFGYIPSLIVTAPDRPVGRHLTLTPSETKIWADQNNVPTLQPDKITAEVIEKIKLYNAELFVVSAYGKILPQALLDIPKHGTLNIHPSLLPLYRGPAPERGPILAGENETGVTVILLDALVDHGPIIAQEKYPLDENKNVTEVAKDLFTRGGTLLAEKIPEWIKGSIQPTQQDHSKATFTKKVKKEDGEISLNGNPRENYNKYRAYIDWPGVFFFKDMGDKKLRIKVTQARFENDSFIIEKVIPEGKKEISYSDFLKQN